MAELITWGIGLCVIGLIFYVIRLDNKRIKKDIDIIIAQVKKRKSNPSHPHQNGLYMQRVLTQFLCSIYKKPLDKPKLCFGV